MPSPRSRAHGSLLNGIGQGDASVTVDEETRNEVFEAFKVSHGAKIAGALLEMLPSAGVPELATKADLALVRTEMGALEARLGERIESALRGVQSEVQNELRDLRGEMRGLHGEMGGLHGEMGDLRGEMRGIETNFQKELRDQTGRFIGWMFAAAGLSVAAASAIGRLG